MIDLTPEKMQEANDEPAEIPPATPDLREAQAETIERMIARDFTDLQFELLGKGGEHLVYHAVDHEKNVVKVDMRSAERGAAMFGTAGSIALQGADLSSARSFLNERRARVTVLRDTFGKDHTLAQRSMIARVPVTPELEPIVSRGNGDQKAEAIWALVTVQERTEALADPEHLSVTSGYAEKTGGDTTDAYDRLTGIALGNKEAPDPNDLDMVQNNTDMHALLIAARTDPQLRDQMRIFAVKAAEFTRQTGETLDLAGKDNVLFSKESGAWNYVMPDALYPSPLPQMPGCTEALMRLKLHVPAEPHDANVLLNTLNYVRTINGLLTATGSPSTHLLTVPGGEDVDLEALRELISSDAPKQDEKKDQKEGENA